MYVIEERDSSETVELSTKLSISKLQIPKVRSVLFVTGIRIIMLEVSRCCWNRCHWLSLFTVKQSTVIWRLMVGLVEKKNKCSADRKYMLKGKRQRCRYLYSAPWEAHLWSGQVWITQFLRCIYTHHTCLYLVSVSPDYDSSHLIAAYYSFVDPRMMKVGVGLFI